MINFEIISESIKFYEAEGFHRIETPWMVSEYSDSITRPNTSPPINVPIYGKNLVASGEQGFLELYLKDYLPKGRFQTVTPCFRYEKLDLTHKSHFLKNELIITDDVSNKSLEQLVDTSMEFFSRYFRFNDLEIQETPYGYDISYKGHELGSYGIRSCEFLDWVYGTGCAEPRTSTLIGKEGI